MYASNFFIRPISNNTLKKKKNEEFEKLMSFIDDAKCPNCGTPTNLHYKNPKFCLECGETLKPDIHMSPQDVVNREEQQPRTIPPSEKIEAKQVERNDEDASHENYFQDESNLGSQHSYDRLREMMRRRGVDMIPRET